MISRTRRKVTGFRNNRRVISSPATCFDIFVSRSVSAMPLEIRLIKDSEYKTVVDFFNNARGINHQAGKRQRTHNQFCWEFMNSPDRKTIYAGAWAMETGQQPVMVGIQCAILHKMISADGDCVLAAKGEDTLIEVSALLKFKKTDILKELFAVLTAECRKKGVAYLWGFNNIPASYKRLGLESPFKSFYAVLVLNPLDAYKHITSAKPEEGVFRNIKMAILAGLAYIYTLKRIVVFSKNPRYSMNSGMDDNTDLFRRAAQPQMLFFLHQDHAYLQWRTRKNPYPVTYKSLQLLGRDDKLQAQVICSVNSNVAFIEQTLFDKKLKKSHINFLLKTVIRSLKNENICMVRYTGFNNNILNRREMKLLQNTGFVFTGKGEWFTYKKLTDNCVINPENIYLSRLYKQGIN